MDNANFRVHVAESLLDLAEAAVDHPEIVELPVLGRSAEREHLLRMGLDGVENVEEADTLGHLYLEPLRLFMEPEHSEKRVEQVGDCQDADELPSVGDNRQGVELTLAYNFGGSLDRGVVEYGNGGLGHNLPHLKAAALNERRHYITFGDYPDQLPVIDHGTLPEIKALHQLESLFGAAIGCHGDGIGRHEIFN
jgi:hypothetical protein